jgi:histidine triad (HIT) family protein
MLWRELILRIARSRLLGRCIRWSFAHMSFVLPVKRLYESESLIAFPHPRPSYALHILIVPKRSIGSFIEIPPGETAFMHDLPDAVAVLVRRFNLERVGYRLITNGGAYQDVPLLHFHLVSDDAVLAV